MSGRESGFNYAKLVTIRGDQRQGGNSNTDFTMNFGQFNQKIGRVSIASVTFQNNAYNVNSEGGGKNNTFSLRIDDLQMDFELEGGWYTTTTLISVVQDAINDALTDLGEGQSISFSQDTTTQLVSISYDPGTSGQLTIILEDTNDESGVWELLGFVPPVVVSSPTPRVATYFPSLGGLSNVYLRSNALAPSNMVESEGKLSNVLLVIPVTAAFGFENVFECKVDKLCEISYFTPRNCQTLDFQLTDRVGNILNLHGGNVTLNLKFWYPTY